MKGMLSLLKQPHVLTVMIRSAVSKIVIGLCAVLLWNRFLNETSTMPRGIVDTGFFAPAVWFILAAWIQYLAFDGVRPFRFLQTAKNKDADDSKKSVRLTDILGFATHSINDMDGETLDDDEVIAAKLCSNLLAALFFLIPNLLANYWLF